MSAALAPRCSTRAPSDVALLVPHGPDAGSGGRHDRVVPGEGVHMVADQRERLVGIVGVKRSDMARSAAIANQRHRAVLGDELRARTSAEFMQQLAAVEPHGLAIAGDQRIEIG